MTAALVDELTTWAANRDALLRTPAEEATLTVWAEGWDAAVAWLWPLWQRAERDADLWHERAVHTPEQLKQLRRQRMDAAIVEFEHMSTEVPA